MTKQGQIVGIDLGTTLSAIAIVDEHGVPRIISNAEGEKLTPSVVFLGDDGILVGQDAIYAGVLEPQRAIRAVKRDMGEHYSLCEYLGQRYYPDDVSAQILGKLKRDAEAALGYPIQDAVISVPAHFSEASRRATKSAGAKAGLNVVRLIAEPTAAALAFGMEQKDADQTILVYDLGGGTFDATLMHLQGCTVQTQAVEGEFELGGIDFDNQIIEYAAKQFIRKYGFDPTEDREAAAELRERAEQVKKMLSRQEQVSILVRGKGYSMRVPLTREQFESMIAHLLKASLMRVEMVLDAAKLRRSEVDDVLLVGGSTRIPLVQRMLHDYFGKPSLSSIDPDEAVALGAALAGGLAMLEERNLRTALSAKAIERLSPLTFREVIPYSFGVEVLDTRTNDIYNHVLIARNSSIPTSQVGHFETAEDNATSILLTVLLGDSRAPNDCQVLGKFTIEGLPSGHPKGSPIRVRYTCNRDGIIEVEAVDVTTSKRLTATVRYTRGPVP